MLRFPNDLRGKPRSHTGNTMAGSPDFGIRLATLRKQRNMTQTDLSKLVGIHYTHIGRYEVGRSMPAADTLQKLAEGLSTTVDYLMNGAAQETAKIRLSDQELLECFRQATLLPDEDKFLVKRFLESFLQMRQIQSITKRSA